MAFVFNPFTGTLDITGGGGATSHNSLPDLQGGTTAQYYHLTQAQHSAVTGYFGTVVTLNSPSVPLVNYALHVITLDDTFSLPASPSPGDTYRFLGVIDGYATLNAGANFFSVGGVKTSHTLNLPNPSATDRGSDYIEVVWANGYWYVHSQNFLDYMAGLLPWSKVDKTGAAAGDIGALSSSATKIPFFKSDGSSSSIALTADSKIPFTVSAGTTSNIPLTT